MTANDWRITDTGLPESHKVETMYWVGLGLSIRTGWTENWTVFRIEAQVAGFATPATRSVLFRTQYWEPSKVYGEEVHEENAFTETIRFHVPTPRTGWSRQELVGTDGTW